MLPQLLLLVASALDASAHMALHYPPPLKAEHNPHTRGRPDKAQHYPHGCCDQQTMAPFPCRGHLNLLDTPEGDPVASWPAGSLQHWTMYAPPPLGSTHYGGSAQVGTSNDKGQTFRVLASYLGNVPRRKGGKGPTGQKFPVRIPGDHPLGNTLFAWSWTNREQETFMNCAVVNITERLEYAPGQSARMIGATRPVEKCRLSGSLDNIFELPTSKPSSEKPSTPGTDKKASKPPSREEGTSKPAQGKGVPSGENEALSTDGQEEEHSAPNRGEKPSTPSRDKDPAKPGRDKSPTPVAEKPQAEEAPKPHEEKDEEEKQKPHKNKSPWTLGWGKSSPGWYKPWGSQGWGSSQGWERKPAAPSWHNKPSTPSWFSASNWYKNNNQKKHQWLRRDVGEAVEVVAFDQRPNMFFTNVDNGCYSPKTNWELQYPNPGPPDDIVLGDCEYPMDLPCGTCGKPVDPKKCPVKVPGNDGDADGEP